MPNSSPGAGRQIRAANAGQYTGPMTLRYVECPRDSWQGFKRQIPTEEKRDYLRALLKAGFRRLDLGSFVSIKAVPQMADSEEVLATLERPEGADFLCIIANERGLERALKVESVSSVGYPLAVNDTFQRRNTGKSLEASWPLVAGLFKEASAHGLGFVVYLSMAFGNPYGEPWDPEAAAHAAERLRDLGVSQIVLADTVGTATPERIRVILEAVSQPRSLGLHLHARPNAWREQLEVALDFGLHWFEGALAGVGGCPFADDALLGNLPTERVLPWLTARGLESGIALKAVPGLRAHAEALRLRYE
jgi:hydroxymethylglutaryl-CoA lyase